MRKISLTAVILLFLFFLNSGSAYPQVTSASKKVETKTADVNKDGKPDVTYYSDGEHVEKVEADTNYDGKPDVTIEVEDGEFKSAQVDTDYDGQPDKKFTDEASFNQWVNENRPEFKEQLNRPDWQFNMLKF